MWAAWVRVHAPKARSAAEAGDLVTGLHPIDIRTVDTAGSPPPAFTLWTTAGILTLSYVLRVAHTVAGLRDWLYDKCWLRGTEGRRQPAWGGAREAGVSTGVSRAAGHVLWPYPRPPADFQGPPMMTGSSPDRVIRRDRPFWDGDLECLDDEVGREPVCFRAWTGRMGWSSIPAAPRSARWIKLAQG